MAQYDDATIKLKLESSENAKQIRLLFSEEPDFVLTFESGMASREDKEVYPGPYEVTPSVVEQAFPTARKYLNADIHVLSIPYHEVENTERGKTAIIGGI